MSHEALIADLRRKSAVRITRLKAKAELEVDTFREQKEAEYQEKRKKINGQLKIESERIGAPLIHEAKRKALAIEDEAMRRLAGRMYEMALQLLEEIRSQGYESFFAELVSELPEVTWETVRVNPDDAELAEKYFSGCHVETDQEIQGGFIATADGGNYQVVNTLQKRLEKGWPLILVRVLQKLQKEKDAKPAA